MVTSNSKSRFNRWLDSYPDDLLREVEVSIPQLLLDRHDGDWRYALWASFVDETLLTYADIGLDELLDAYTDDQETIAWIVLCTSYAAGDDPDRGAYLLLRNDPDYQVRTITHDPWNQEFHQ